MSELLSQLWTPEMQMLFSVVVVLLVILYVLSIIWVVRDAYLRGMTWYIWAIVALVPVLGVIAYCILRPPMLKIDRDEQNLEVALKQRQLMQYGECANCGYPVEADYVLCPSCHTQLKNLCVRCKRALEPAWTVCPYCATPVQGAGASTHQSSSRSTARTRSTSSSRTTSSARSSARGTSERERSSRS